MTIRRHVVIFTRELRLGRGKRRLANRIGAVAALHFQRVALRALLYRLGTELVVRLPRFPDAARRLEVELDWLPRLGVLPVAFKGATADVAPASTDRRRRPRRALELLRVLQRPRRQRLGRPGTPVQLKEGR